MKEEALEFSLTVASAPVTLDGKPYTLRELTGAQRDQYLTTSAARLLKNEEGKAIGVKDFNGHQSELLCLALTDDSTNTLVPQETIAGWPGSTVSKLFKKAQALSNLEGPQTAANTTESEKAVAKAASVEKAKND